MDLTQYVDKIFQAQVQMLLPSGRYVSPGQTFRCTAGYIERGARPDLWVSVGTALIVEGVRVDINHDRPATGQDAVIPDRALDENKAPLADIPVPAPVPLAPATTDAAPTADATDHAAKGRPGGK